MRKVQVLLSSVLMIGAFVAVVLLAQVLQPPTYEVVVAIKEVPPFTALEENMLAVDTQSVSPAIADRYVLADELPALLQSGAVAVENLRPGQPLLREAVASGANAERVSRLAVAINDPNLVILAVPVKSDSLPAVYPGDAVALIYANGSVQTQQIVTATISGPTPTPEPVALGVISETQITLAPHETACGSSAGVTTELQMPVAKWLVNGVVYRLNREIRENPDYGAPGKENEPRYIEGDIKSLDVVIARQDAEWLTFALANGRVQVGLLPAVVRAQVEQNAVPATAGVTWSDFEDRFFADRVEP